jgi:hypothetical protein
MNDKGNTVVQIRSDLPQPPRSKVRAPITLAFARMKIGDSVDIPVEAIQRPNLYRAARWTKIKIQMRTLINGFNDAVTSVVPKGQPFYRVWRRAE